MSYCSSSYSDSIINDPLQRFTLLADKINSLIIPSCHIFVCRSKLHKHKRPVHMPTATFIIRTNDSNHIVKTITNYSYITNKPSILLLLLLFSVLMRCCSRVKAVLLFPLSPPILPAGETIQEPICWECSAIKFANMPWTALNTRCLLHKLLNQWTVQLLRWLWRGTCSISQDFSEFNKIDQATFYKKTLLLRCYVPQSPHSGSEYVNKSVIETSHAAGKLRVVSRIWRTAVFCPQTLTCQNPFFCSSFSMLSTHQTTKQIHSDIECICSANKLKWGRGGGITGYVLKRSEQFKIQ